MSIPNALPTLSAGAHTPKSGQACVMEYFSLLAGEKWSDSPTCTYRPLARAAQVVNDRLSDDDRHLLVPLIGRLFGTALPVDNGLFALRVARTVTEAYVSGTAYIEEELSAGQAFAAANAAAAAACAANAATAAASLLYATYATNVAAATASDPVAWLGSVIDIYNELSGRIEHRDVSDSELAALTLAVRR